MQATCINLGFLLEKHRTGLGFYTIGIGKEVYRTNGVHNASSVGVLLGYVNDRKDFIPVKVDTVTDEWYVKSRGVYMRLRRTDFWECDHIVFSPHDKNGLVIVAPLTLEREVLV